MSVTQFYPIGFTSGLTGPNLGIMTIQANLETLDIYSDEGYINDLNVESISETSGTTIGATGPMGPTGGQLISTYISPTYTDPYIITSGDANKQFFVTTLNGGVIFGDTSSAPTMSKIGICSLSTATAIQSQVGLDPYFDINANSYVNVIVEQPDGKILIGGSFDKIGGVAHNYIVRLNTDWSIDAGFNADADSEIFAIVLQPDGKIIIGGTFANVNSITRYYIARLNTDGTLDESFDPSANDWVNTLALQQDGKILVGGYFSTIGGDARNYIARLNPNGTLDNTFNPDADGAVQIVKIQETDGKILVGGYFNSFDGGATTRNYLARLNINGTVDNGFDPNPDYVVNAIAVQTDDKIVIGGAFYTVGTTARVCIARINPDGTLDTGFNPDPDSDIFAVALQPDGKILIGGYFSTLNGGTISRNYIARLNTDGSVDLSFNPNLDSPALTIILMTDGNIMFGGYFSTVGGVTRLYVALLNAVYISSILQTSYVNGGFLTQNQAITMQKITTDNWLVVGRNW